MPQYKLLGKRPLNARAGKPSWVAIRRTMMDNVFVPNVTTVKIVRTNGQIWDGKILALSPSRPQVGLAEVTITDAGGGQVQFAEDKPDRVKADTITVTVGGVQSDDPQPTPPPYNEDEDGGG